jgi:hypothetical protein
MNITVADGIAAQVMLLIQIVKNFLPDQLESKWLPIIGIGISIGLAMAAGLDWMQGFRIAVQAAGQFDMLKVGASTVNKVITPPATPDKPIETEEDLK